jgi:predicted nuclease of predicted toxin-antitoxin system
MIVADENIHAGIILSLRNAGIPVVSIAERYSGIKDEEVIKRVLNLDYLLLTEDKDFGEWVFAHHVKDLSVIFLRYNHLDYIAISSTLINLLTSKKLEKPFFLTVTTKKIRIRKL